MLVYVVLLPLVLLQAAGLRRPIRSEGIAKVPFGLGVGTMYSLTTISGPPLALFWRNQGLDKHELRATLAQIRIAEGLSTATAYYFLSLYSPLGFQISTLLLLPMVIGIQIGRYAIRTVKVDTFRMLTTSFDAWIIGFGISKTVVDLHLASITYGYTIFAVVALIQFWLLYRFFNQAKPGRLTLGVSPSLSGHG